MKCDLAASCCALSLRFSSRSRELEQKAPADSPHRPRRAGAVHPAAGEPVPGLSFAPRQAGPSAGGTPGNGVAAGWARRVTQESWVPAKRAAMLPVLGRVT